MSLPKKLVIGAIGLYIIAVIERQWVGHSNNVENFLTAITFICLLIAFIIWANSTA